MSDGKYGRIFTEENVKDICSNLLVDVGVEPHNELINTNVDGFRGKFPYGEPVFVVRAQDVVAPQIVKQYAAEAFLHGASESFRKKVENAVSEFEQWQSENDERVKIPD